ncbi:hypothetical protein H5410_037510, partial [Solanum commersonii]
MLTFMDSDKTKIQYSFTKHPIPVNKVSSQTPHFIDRNWVLHKRILNLCSITSHKGEHLVESISNCLLDWILDNVFIYVTCNVHFEDICELDAYLKECMTSDDVDLREILVIRFVYVSFVSKETYLKESNYSKGSKNQSSICGLSQRKI